MDDLLKALRGFDALRDGEAGGDVVKRAGVMLLDLVEAGQLHWVDMETGEIVDLKLARAKFLEHFANLAPCLVAMEACGGSQHWARRIRDLGHEVRLLPAKMVRPFVGGNKNDAHDARAIWTAVPRQAHEPTQEVVAERLRKVRQGVKANRSDRDPPSLNDAERREARNRNEARIGRFHQGQWAESPAPKAGYKTAICLPVIPKSVLAFREASIQRVMIVALARKLLVGLWKFVTTGVVPEGAIMSAA